MPLSVPYDGISYLCSIYCKNILVELVSVCSIVIAVTLEHPLCWLLIPILGCSVSRLWWLAGVLTPVPSRLGLAGLLPPLAIPIGTLLSTLSWERLIAHRIASHCERRLLVTSKSDLLWWVGYWVRTLQPQISFSAALFLWRKHLARLIHRISYFYHIYMVQIIQISILFSSICHNFDMPNDMHYIKLLIYR